MSCGSCKLTNCVKNNNKKIHCMLGTIPNVGEGWVKVEV